MNNDISVLFKDVLDCKAFIYEVTSTCVLWNFNISKTEVPCSQWSSCSLMSVADIDEVVIRQTTAHHLPHDWKITQSFVARIFWQGGKL